MKREEGKENDERRGKECWKESKHAEREKSNRVKKGRKVGGGKTESGREIKKSMKKLTKNGQNIKNCELVKGAEERRRRGATSRRKGGEKRGKEEGRREGRKWRERGGEENL